MLIIFTVKSQFKSFIGNSALFFMFAGFGCSVYIAEKFCNKQKSSSALSIPKLLQIVSSLFVTVIMEYIKLPQDSDAVFYMAAFCKFFIMMSVVVLVIPQIFDKFGVEEQEEKQKS